ncbi:hypothetical protein [Thermotoga sp.]|uniref:hypothetical protein n=1 Tax=Thermotoga sp. TaxID=28240 RepID=UPI0025D79C50|nr:hypothetical protein [Thermotoga sp.]MCD6551288.1 hypothetical protein [Thermotoga sp.]
MRVIFGIFLVFIGVLLLMSIFLDAFTFSFFARILHNLSLFWPLILITLGVYFLYLGLKKKWVYFLSVGVFVVFLVLLLAWPYESASTLEKSQVFTGVKRILFKKGGFTVHLSEGEEFRISTSDGIEVLKIGSDLIVRGSLWRKLSPKMVEIEIPKGTFELSFENGAFTMKGEFRENRFTRIEARDCVLNAKFSFQKANVPLYFEAEDSVLEALFKVPGGTSYFVEKKDGLLSKTIEGNLFETDVNPKLFFNFKDGIFHIHLEGSL